MINKLRMICKKIIPCFFVLLLCIPVTACQKQADSITVETDTTYSDNMKCILISEETKELTFDEVVKQKQKLLNESEDQIKNMLSEKENLIRSELNENGRNGQDAGIHYYFINGTFAYPQNEDYQIRLSAYITAVETPDEEEWIYSADEFYSTLVKGKHHAVWNEGAVVSTISVYKDTVRLAASGFFDIYENHMFEEPGFSLCTSEPVVALTSETLNPVLLFELPK